ncbi:MAG TPA: nitrite/sulfite reductase [Gemmatimonadaceae bacterium]
MTNIEGDTTATETAGERKETPAQRVERIKREKPSWSIMDEIRRYAPLGFSAIPLDDLNVRFRAWGLYTQGDGNGTRGEEQPYFMMRLRTPNGLLTADMLSTVADLADRYARGTIDITNRQNFQLHWLRIENVPAVWDALERVGWTSQGSCGDNTRTVTGCPLAGAAHDELIDASPIALEVDRFLNGNPDFANFPRKFKITITGCAHWCTYPEINDIGATAVRRDDGVVGFNIWLGGGLSTRAHLAKRLPAFVHAHQVRDVVGAVAGIFRDSDELRLNRGKARMKFLFLNHGWTVEKFLEDVERRIGYRLDPPASDAAPDGSYRDHVGVHAQKQVGLYYAGLSVLAGRISTDQLRRAAELAREFGDGSLRLTAMQNIVILNVRGANIPRLVAAARDADLPLAGSAFQRGTVACTGSEFCKLAITETKKFSIGLAQELEARVPGFNADIKLHVTGCPNSCGQHWIADVGLQGVMMNRDGEQAEGYDVFVGGALGVQRAVARRLGLRIPASEVAEALSRLFLEFTHQRVGGEPFSAWVNRVSDPALREMLVHAPQQTGAAA